MDDEQLLRYSRHILLPEIGIEGQQRLLDAHVLMIGAGGLGSPAALYLASAGVGTLTICDGDVVDLTNRAGTKPCGQLAVRLRVARCAPPE
jgi:adenylyltransferase/sulfurtransferase